MRSIDSVTAIICVHNQHELAQRCIRSIEQQAPAGLQVLVVDDQSTPAFTYQSQSAAFEVEVLRNPRRLGYTRSANRALRHCAADTIVLVNSDVEFPDGSFARLLRPLDHRADLCSPLSNAASWQSVPRRFNSRKGWSVNASDGGYDAQLVSEIVARVSRQDYPQVPLLNGFCIAMKAEVIDKIGLFDEQSFPVGYGEENDLCIRAGQADFRCVIADDTYVYHAKSKSFGHWRRWWYSRRGGLALARKWGQQSIDEMVAQMRDNPTLAYMRQAVAGELATMTTRCVD